MVEGVLAPSNDLPPGIDGEAFGKGDRIDAPKWVVLDFSRTFGGHQEMTARILQVLMKTRARSLICFLPEGADRTAGRLNEIQPAPQSRLHRIEPSRGSWLRPGQWGAWSRLLREIADEAPNRIVVVAGGLEEAWRGAAIGRLLGLKTTIYVPSTRTMASVGAKLGSIRDRMALWVIGRATRIVVISPRQRQELVARGREPDGIGLLENFMDPPNPSPPIDRSEAGIRPSVGIVGRIDLHAKGLDILLALAEIGSSRYHYHVVGDGPDLEALRERMRDSSLADQCTFHGWRDPWSLPLDVLLLPSRMEGVPLVAVEAVLRGIPVLAADLPETRELLPAPWLFDRNDPAGLESRLDWLRSLANLPQVDELRSVFQARFLRRPSAREIVRAIEADFGSVGPEF